MPDMWRLMTKGRPGSHQKMKKEKHGAIHRSGYEQTRSQKDTVAEYQKPKAGRARRDQIVQPAKSRWDLCGGRGDTTNAGQLTWEARGKLPENYTVKGNSGKVKSVIGHRHRKKEGHVEKRVVLLLAVRIFFVRRTVPTCPTQITCFSNYVSPKGIGVSAGKKPVSKALCVLRVVYSWVLTIGIPKETCLSWLIRPTVAATVGGGRVLL